MEGSCYLYLQSLNTQVEQKTVQIMIPTSQKSDFRLKLSMIYAGIVLVLIGGFYALAFIDSSMRSTIFAQQSGIQFITLFSLVIAIILFGVLEILQDKELAALLGGISGYILGRVTTDRQPSGGAPQSSSVSGTTISFAAPNRINDAGAAFGVFSPGDRIRVTGTAHNNNTYTIQSVSHGAIEVRETNVQDEAAGPTVRITSA